MLIKQKYNGELTNFIYLLFLLFKIMNLDPHFLSVQAFHLISVLHLC